MEDEEVEEEGPAQVQVQEKAPVQAARSEPGYHGNLDLHVADDDEPEVPVQVPEPRRPQRLRSSRFIPDFDW